MPPDQEEFLEWLLSDPKDPRTQQEWAVQRGYHPDSIKRWKRDPRFIERWEQEAAKKNISVDRVQMVVDSLHRAAVNGDTKAAALYLQYINKFIPTKKVVVESEREIESLSDEEIEQQLRQLLGAEE